MTPAARQGLSLAEVKAAFILNFIRFSEWPKNTFEEPDGPIIILVAGKGDIEDPLTRLSRTTRINGRPIKIVTFDAPENPPPCHVFYLGEMPRAAFLGHLRALGGRDILVVGDRPETTSWGAVLAFKPMKARMQFEVNRREARARHIRLSSQLLKLASKITD